MEVFTALICMGSSLLGGEIHLIRWLISLLPQFPGTRVLELDWLPLRTNKDDPLVLCVAGADRVTRKLGDESQTSNNLRDIPAGTFALSSIAPHTTWPVGALRMILQLGVKPSWFDAFSSVMSQDYSNVPGTPSAGDLRKYMIDSPTCVADYAVPNMLLKVLEPYHREACLLDDERVRLYSKVVKRGSTLRLAFAAAVFGKSMEALFWLQLPHDLNHPMNKLADKLPQKGPHTARTRDVDEASMSSRMFKKNHCPSLGMLWLLKLGDKCILVLSARK
ncbi:hypothetical protein OROHE_006086 [Orobanche hederae]